MSPKYVRDLMTDEVKTLNPNDDLGTFRDVLSEHDVRHVPVVDDEGNMVGLVSQRDLLRNVLTEQADVPLSVRDESMQFKTIGDIMTRDVETVTPEDSIQAAAETMFANKYGCLPVTEAGRVVGILTESDFVRYFAEQC